MEIKDNKLIIDIPKGMEIDTENTDEAKGVIMLRKKKGITYEEIVHYGLSIDINKIDAIQKLAYIAKFYNGDWEPEWNNLNEDSTPTALDVYKGKTELKITYDGKIPVDSVVIYKKGGEK